ncbi:MAG: ADP-ribosylglycohydrolase family protein [Planctomycetes bacterium]|nr:ADP-ribosylglycohydrolase family protein [Planctomycetota bacterium]
MNPSPSTSGLPSDYAARMDRARLSLDGLSVGDAFGETFFYRESSVVWAIHQRQTDSPPWRWTDDTATAISIVETLAEHGRIDQDALAERMAQRYALEPWRGYGAAAQQILADIGEGASWRAVSSAAFGGEGSMGNGSAMRVAPVGAYFSDDLESVVENARLSAEVTHYHPDGRAGAIAVAVAAAMAWRLRESQQEKRRRELLQAVLDLTPAGSTHDGLQKAAALPVNADVETAIQTLGNGSNILCLDTVPFCIWCAAGRLDNFEEAMWTTVSGLGDRDTTCAIVGGIVSLSAGRESIPPSWLSAREPLPEPALGRGEPG